MFFIIPFIVLIPGGIYLYFFGKRFLTLFGWDAKSTKSRGVSVLFALLCLFSSVRIYGLGAVIVLHFIILSVLLELVQVIVNRFSHNERFRRIWSFCYRSGIISVVLIAIIFTYGYFNMKHVGEKDYTIVTEKESGKGLVIAQISDLHMGTTMDGDDLKKYCDEIQKKNPDILALTGDIFDESTTRLEMEEAVRILSGVKTKYGIYYVFGNHDYNTYTASPTYQIDELRQALADAGIVVLEDKAVQVTEGVTVVGRVDASRGRDAISEVMKEVSKDSFLILLDHQPKELEENAAAGIDLQLSGHTHAGQVFPTGQVSLLFGWNEMNYGCKKIDNTNVIVSSGIAGWGYAMRTGGHSEYVVVNVE